jgi:hypothetical protein
VMQQSMIDGAADIPGSARQQDLPSGLGHYCRRIAQSAGTWPRASSTEPGWLATFGVLVLAAIPRLSALRAFLAHDETLYWEWARAFFFALIKGDWLGTIVGPGNPSITIFWDHTLVMGLKYIWAWLAGGLDTALATWPDFQSKATLDPLIERRVPIVLFNTLAVVIAYRLLYRLFGGRVAAVAAVLLALDPFFLADSRTSRGEGLVASLMMLAALLVLTYLTSMQWRYLLFSGVLAGLALLTKISTLGLVVWGAVGVMTFGVLCRQRKIQLKWMVMSLLVWGLVAAATFWALWPAMWVSPTRAFGFLTHFISDVGVDGRDNYFFGQVYHNEPLPLYYLVVYVLRVTPLAWLGLLAAPGYLVYSWFRRGRPDATETKPPRLLLMALVLGLAVIYGVMMSAGTLKRDWYILPAFPALDIVAAAGLVWLGRQSWKLLKRRAARIPPRAAWTAGILTLVVAQIVVILPSAPYYYTYWNPAVLGSRWAATAVVLWWDVELSASADYLNTKPGAEKLSAATRTTRGFEQIFKGHTIRWVPDTPWIQADYLVIRTFHLQTRKIEPAMLDYLARLKLDHVVTLNGVDYAYIYEGRRAEHFAGPSELVGKATLLGYDLGYPQPAAGDAFTLRLYWQNEGMAPDDVLFWRLVDAGGYIWAESVAEPTNGFEEATLQKDQFVESQVSVQVPVGTPPGIYILNAGVHNRASGKTLGYFALPSDGDKVTVVTPAQPALVERLALQHKVDAYVSPELTLLGFDLPGDALELGKDNWLTLYWQANDHVRKDYVVAVQLLTPDGEEVAYWLGRPVKSSYPTYQWTKGEIVRDPWHLETSGGTLPGEYALQLTLYDAETQDRVSHIRLGNITVVERRK